MWSYCVWLYETLFSCVQSCSSQMRGPQKWCLRRMTKKCEIERICNVKTMHNHLMSTRFCHSIFLSKNIEYKKIIFYLRPFPVATALKNIVNVKQIAEAEPVIIANIGHSLKDLRFINLSYTKLVETLKKKAFDKSNISHIKMIETFWDNMKPDIRRSAQELVSSDWGDLGFQGKDPSTDFRVRYNNNNVFCCKSIILL
jgi:hypothetical protein